MSPGIADKNIMHESANIKTKIFETVSFFFLVNKGNSSIPLIEIHKSIEEKTKSTLQTKTEGNTSNIRGEQRHNRKTTLKYNTQSLIWLYL